jgi:hypothetical protein
MYCSRVEIRLDDIQLAEGAGIGVFRFDELKEMRLSPFVERTIRAHERQLLSESLNGG